MLPALPGTVLMLAGIVVRPWPLIGVFFMVAKIVLAFMMVRIYLVALLV